MDSVTKSIQDFLVNDGIRFKKHRDGFKIGFAGDNGHFLCFVGTGGKIRRVHIQTLLPLQIPVAKRTRVAELIARINNYPFVGGFELDMDEGTICYKTSIILDKAPLHYDIMKHLLFANWHVADKYFPAFVMFIFGDVPPKTAIEKVRKSKADETQTEGTDTRVLNIRLRDILGGSSN